MSDLIDRKILLAKFEDICEMCGKRDENSGVMCRCCYLDDAISMTEDLPSAEPERKKEKWIEYPDCLRYEGAYADDQIVCSECHHVFSILDNCTEEFDFCPSCGADMRGEDGKA